MTRHHWVNLGHVSSEKLQEQLQETSLQHWQETMDFYNQASIPMFSWQKGSFHDFQRWSRTAIARKHGIPSGKRLQFAMENHSF